MFVPASETLFVLWRTITRAPTPTSPQVSTELLCFLSTGLHATVLFSLTDRKQEAEAPRRVNSTGNITSISVAALCHS